MYFGKSGIWSCSGQLALVLILLSPINTPRHRIIRRRLDTRITRENRDAQLTHPQVIPSVSSSAKPHAV